MKRFFQTAAVATLLAAASVCANASMLATVTHDYGSVDGANAKNTANSCDTLNASSITVRNTKSGCARFFDTFDFGAIAPGTVTSLSLTLSFANTGDSLEYWAMRPASSGTIGSTNVQYLDRLTATTSQTFLINNISNPDVFNTIASTGKFSLWFAQNGLGTQDFTLNAATLDVNSNAVPEPASLALFGIAALAIGAVRRRAGQRTAS